MRHQSDPRPAAWVPDCRASRKRAAVLIIVMPDMSMPGEEEHTLRTSTAWTSRDALQGHALVHKRSDPMYPRAGCAYILNATSFGWSAMERNHCGAGSPTPAPWSIPTVQKSIRANHDTQESDNTCNFRFTNLGSRDRVAIHPERTAN